MHIDVHGPFERMLSMNPPAELHCTLSGTVAELPAFFERMEDWALDHGVPLPLASSFGLMLDELLTNVATHGYQGQGGPVSVQLAFDANGLATPNMLYADAGALGRVTDVQIGRAHV